MPTTITNFGGTMKLSSVFTILSLFAPFPTLAQKAGQSTFSSADAANLALFAAVQDRNDQIVMKILGVNVDGIFSGDDAQDRLDMEHFSEKYKEMHRLGREPDGTQVLYVGAENWPFPFPLTAKNGTWYFDSSAGLNEILFRRIGENEMAAVEHLQALWNEIKEPSQPAGVPNVVTDDHPLHGYLFRAVKRHAPRTGAATNKIVFVAYPAEYRSCGVMTFVITQAGLVYEKDLGPNTEHQAKVSAKFNLNDWHLAE